MFLSNSVLHRYTPPTCTLEIVSSSSPLSRWMGRSVLKQLQFELRFDDPRLPEEQQVNIRGDRGQLEVLDEVVTTYVQDLLNSSPEQFNTIFSGGAISSDTPVSSNPQVLGANDAPVLVEEPHSLDSDTSALGVEDTSKNSTATRFRKIFLQPGRGLSHNLFLGSLATEKTGAVIRLSVLQLFDLAIALDQYAADLVVLPTPTRSVPVLPAWTSIAAVLLLGVGLTTIVQLFNRSDQRQQTATTISPGDQQSIALQPSPTPPLSSLQTLPPPPPIGSIPSTNSVPPISVPGANPALPGAPRVNAPPTTLVNPSPRQTTPQQIVIKPTPRQDRSGSITGETARRSGARSPNSSVAIVPSPSPQTTPRNPNLEAALRQVNRGAVPPPAESNSNSPAQPSRLPSTPTTSKNPTRSAFDTIPQVAEVRGYFQQRWQPPASLKETLEYSIILSTDGSIQRIEPLGQAASTYIDRTDMPLPGESFVSPIQSGRTPRIRLVLTPDGKVQTFLEEIVN